MKDIFCTRCQEVTPHKGAVDSNGELVFTCQNVMVENSLGEEVGHHFIKMPGNLEVDEVEAKLEEHQTANEGQVSLEGQEDKLNEVMGAVPASDEDEDEQEDDTETEEK